jgi:hypothetical protein
VIALCALLLGSLARQTVPPEPLPSPTTAATPAIGTPAPTPVATAPTTPAPSAAPPTATPTPAAVSETATPSPYHYRFVPRPPAHAVPGQPQIYAVYLNEKKLRSLGPIDIRVETNPEVVKVVSRSNGRDGIVPLVSPGVFVANGRLPKIPFIAEGMSIDLDFIATSADGRKTTVTVPVEIN